MRALLFKAPVFSVRFPKISPGSMRMNRTGSIKTLKITVPALKTVCRLARIAPMAAVKGPATAPATVLDRWAAVFMACR